MQDNVKVKISIVDDHRLFRNGVLSLIQRFNESGELRYVTVINAANGSDFLEQLKKVGKKNYPDILLLDINMPQMNGFETLTQLRKNHPDIKSLVMSMQDDEITLIRSLKLGACGFLTKDIEPEILKSAIDSLYEKGYYYQDLVTLRLIRNLNDSASQAALVFNADIDLSEREKVFLKLVCSEATYSEIATSMNVSVRTIDGYRESLFAKLQVRTRVGLAMWAVRSGLVSI